MSRLTRFGVSLAWLLFVLVSGSMVLALGYGLSDLAYSAGVWPLGAALRIALLGVLIGWAVFSFWLLVQSGTILITGRGSVRPFSLLGAFRMFLGQSALSGKERESILSYVAKAARLIALQDHHAQRYNQALVMHGNSLANPVSAQAMVSASRELAGAADRLVAEHSKFEVPQAAARDYASWHLTHLSYREWAHAQNAGFVALLGGREPMTARLEELMSNFLSQKEQSEAETSTLLQLTGLNASEFQRIMPKVFDVTDEP